MVETFPGWLGSTEVVRVTFDPDVVRFEDLVRQGKAKGCAAPVFALNADQESRARGIDGATVRRAEGTIRPVSDVKYYLGRTALKNVPMTKAQAARINANVENAEAWLSPRQREILTLVTKDPKGPWPTLLGDDVVEGFKKIHRARTAREGSHK